MASRKLTAQDKLALALTSAGSMRELARRMGVSHQKVGRWLRGDSAIPGDALTQKGVAATFTQHRTEVRRQAKRHALPYNPEVPVFMQRKPLRTGELGDRVFVRQTQYIAPELRGRVIAGATTSQKFVSAAVRSRVSLREYFRQRAAEILAERAQRQGLAEPTRREVTRKAQAMEDAFIARENRHRSGAKQIDPEQTFPLYTRAVGLGLGDPEHSARQIEWRLHHKHAPATGKPGTELADQFLFQLAPEDDDTEEDDDSEEDDDQ